MSFHSKLSKIRAVKELAEYETISLFTGGAQKSGAGYSKISKKATKNHLKIRWFWQGKKASNPRPTVLEAEDVIFHFPDDFSAFLTSFFPLMPI